MGKKLDLHFLYGSHFIRSVRQDCDPNICHMNLTIDFECRLKARCQFLKIVF